MDVVDTWQARGRDRLLAGRRVFTIDEGPRDGGDEPPIVLLHGFPTCSFDWRAVLDRLVPTRRVLTLDLLGYGLSEKPDIAYPLGLQADIVNALLADAGLTGKGVALVTHDMGDSVGGELLARDLDGRLAATVVSRVLTNGSIYIEQAHPRVGQRLLLLVGDRSVPLPMVEALFRRGLPEVFGPHTPPSAEEMDAQWRLLSRDGGAQRYPRLIRYYRERSLRQPRWTGAIVRHPSPLHVVWGDRDPVAGMDMVTRLRDERPDLTLTVLEGIGHFPMIEAPERLADLILGATRPR